MSDLWNIFVNNAKDSITRRLIFNVIDLFCSKLLTQMIIHCEIFFFLKLWISLEWNIVSKALATFKLNKIIIRFVFWSQTMCICFVNIFKVVSVDLLDLTFMCASSRSRWVSSSQEVFLLIIDFIIFSKMFNKIIDRYAFEVI